MTEGKNQNIEQNPLNNNLKDFNNIKKLLESLGKKEIELGLGNGKIDLNGDLVFNNEYIKNFINGEINSKNGDTVERQIKIEKIKDSKQGIIFLENLIKTINKKSKIKEETQNLTNGNKIILEDKTYEGDIEFIKNAIIEKSKFYKDNTIVQNILNEFKKYEKSKGTKGLKLHDLSLEMGETIKGLMLDDMNKYYNNAKNVFSDEVLKAVYNSAIDYSKHIGTEGISSIELEGLKSNIDYMKIYSEKSNEINMLYNTTFLKGDELKILKEEGKKYFSNITDSKKLDLTEFKKFIETKTNKNEKSKFDKLKDKEVHEMSIEEAKMALEYTNNNYKELDDRNVTSLVYTLNTIDDYGEIHTFQEKLIKKIIGKDGYKQNGVGFNKDGDLWGFDSKKGNYIIKFGTFWNELQNKNIKDINSKTLSSFLVYMDKNNMLDGKGDMLIQSFGLTKLKELKEIWTNKDYSGIAKEVLKKLNLDFIINLVQNFDFEQYNKGINSPKTIIKTFTEISINIKKFKNPEEKKIAIKTVKGKLKVQKPENFNDINLTEKDIGNYILDKSLPNEIKEIYKESVEKPILESRKKIKEEALEKSTKNVKTKLKEIFSKIFKNDKEIGNKFDKLINSNILLTDLYNKINELVTEYNKKNPNNKIEVTGTKIMNIVNLIINLKGIEVIKNYNDLLRKLDKINSNISQIDEDIKKIKNPEEKKRLIEEKTKQEQKLVSTTYNLEKLGNSKEDINVQKIIGQEIKKEIKKVEEKTGKSITKEQLEEIRKKVEKSEKVIKVKEKKEKIKKQVEKIRNPNISTEERKKIIDKMIEESNKDLLDNSYINDIKELEESLKQVQKDFGVEENTEEIKKESENIEKLKTSEENIQKTANNYKYNTESGIFTIEIGNKTETITVKNSEKEKLKNPESRENYVNFYKTLSEIGLGSLWDYKDNISSIIGSNGGTGLNNNQGFLDNNEQQIFLNSILISVGIKPIESKTNIEEYKNIFKQKNNIQIGEGFKNKGNKKGNSEIEEVFYEKFILNKTTFQTDNFKKSLLNKNK